MKNNSVGWIVAIALPLLVSVAFGQNIPGDLAPPATHSVIDSHGVDVVSGSPGLPGRRVSVGTAQSGIQSDAGRDWDFRDNLIGSVAQSVVSANQATQYLPAGTYMNVVFGGKLMMYQESSANTYVGSTFAPLETSSGTLSCPSITQCVYTAKDGTVAQFAMTYYQPSGSAPASYGSVTQVTKPDGEVLTYSYNGSGYTAGGLPSALPLYWSTSVSSSLGWMIKYQSSGDRSIYGSPTTSGSHSVQAINTSVEYCDPVAPCQGLVNPWPISTLTFSAASQAGPPVTYTYSGKVTDALNDSTTLNWSYTSANGITITVYTKPSGVAYTYAQAVYICPQLIYCGYIPSNGKIKSASVGGYSFGYNYADVYGPPVPAGTGPLRTVGPDGEIDTVTPRALVISYTDNLGRKTQYDYDMTLSSLMSVVDPDATPNLTDPTGGLTSYQYDGRGNITQESVVPKTSGAPLVSSAIYPPTCTNTKTCNKPTSLTDHAGVTTSYTYDPNHGGVLTAIKQAVNGVQAQTTHSYAQQTPYVLNSAGSLVAGPPVWRLVGISQCMTMTLNTCVGTADEVKTIITYGTNNVLPVTKTIERGDGSLAQTTTTSYDIYGNVTSITGPRGAPYDVTYYFYDALRRVVGVIGPDPDGPGLLPRPATATAYNPDGQVSSVATGTAAGTTLAALNAMTVLEQKTTTYSTSIGLPILESVYSGGVLQQVTQKSYDSLLRLQCVAQRLNPATYAALPASACTLGTPPGSQGNDRITYTTYDATNAVLATTSAYGTPRQRNDRVYTYDPTNGLLTTEADGLGNTTFYTYDNWKRRVQTNYPLPTNGAASNPADYTQSIYNPSLYNGALVTSMRLRDGQTINYTYDALSRVSTKSGAVSENFGYDNFGRITSHTNNSTGGSASLTSNYSFNSLGWLQSETRLSGSTSLGAVGYAYDAYGRRSRLTWPDGFSITYNYATNGYLGDDLQSINESGGTLLASFTYDSYGRRSALTRGNGVITSYGYDTLSRLTSLATAVGGTGNSISETFGYTVSSQVLTRSLSVQNQNYIYSPTNASTNFGVNALNQITTANGTALGYDGRGNLTTDNIGGNYSYNANNLLTSATQAGATTTLSYDAENRLFSVSKAGATTQFMYDGQDLIAETDSNGNILRRYVHGPTTDESLVWYEGTGTANKQYYTRDWQGSVVGSTLQSGLASLFNAYDEYGVPQLTNTGRFQYTGQTWLSEVGLYYYRARLYNPVLGRFMQTDPIGYKDDINLYAYVSNDPTDKMDPSGLTCQTTTSIDKKVTYTCQVDSIQDGSGNIVARKDFTDAQKALVAPLDSAYTSAANRLAQEPDKPETVSIPGGGTATFKASLILSELVARTMVAGPTTSGFPETNIGDNVTTFPERIISAGDGAYKFDGGLTINTGDLARQLMIVHEVEHNSFIEATRGNITDRRWDDVHQVPFNKAAADLLGIH